MPRLSDRAFQIIKSEIERRFGDTPQEQIDRVILLSRLESLRKCAGKPMSRVEIWEQLSDIDPYFDDETLVEAAHIDTDSPLVGASIGVGAVAMLVATAIGVETMTVPGGSLVSGSLDDASTSDNRSDSGSTNSVKTLASSKAVTQRGIDANRPEITSEFAARVTQTRKTSQRSQVAKVNGGRSVTQTEPVPIVSEQPVTLRTSVTQPASSQKTAASQSTTPAGAPPSLSSYEMARHFGWKAAVRGQNPPHSAAHWGETAVLWQKAIAHLENVRPSDPTFAAAQQKKVFYQQNLQQIKAHQAIAKAPSPAPAVAQAPAFSKESQPKATVSPAASTDAPTAIASHSNLAEAKRYGWQAALASQNAPHPADKWADISRLWQLAITSLEQVEAQDPDYIEAQQVKARYEQNLAAIRQRYVLEQEAIQSLQSLEATLEELNAAFVPESSKRNQLSAIVVRLKTIPKGTSAHMRAQQLIQQANRQISQMTENDGQTLALGSRE